LFKGGFCAGNSLQVPGIRKNRGKIVDSKIIIYTFDSERNLMKTVNVVCNWKQDLQIEAKAGKHTLIVDQPPTDEGPSPMHYQLIALGGCLGTVASIISRQERLGLRGFSIEFEAEFDPDFLFARTTEGRAGFTEIRAKVDIDVDMTEEEKMEYLEKIDSRCPISDNLMNGTPIKLSLK
jgi:uncharacterized OsmC-like protein